MSFQQTLYTWGYLTPRSERILSELIAVKTPVVDVRLAPVSKHWQWAQGTLEARLKDQYVWIPELGNELYKEALSGRFVEPHVKLREPVAGIARLQEILVRRGRAAIFCACANKTTCHRVKVAELAKKAMPDLKVVHL